MTNQDLLRSATREELASSLRDVFPHLSPSDVDLSPTRGGRVAAQAVLAAIDPGSYEGSRNYLDGAVTKLSAYLRHGVVTLAEVRDHVLGRVTDQDKARKLINELAWRDYWQRLYMLLGEGIWQDREPYKTGYAATDYAAELPEDIPHGDTTLTCMDSFSQQLRETGYLHNHARMWFAAYVVHWRRVHWQEGAGWFLEHLIDGDPASNNLSWQWIASTFASKAYIFNRENLERYTAGVYCRTCPHAQARTCPFDHTYEALEQTLFPRLRSPESATDLPAPPRPFVSANSGERSPDTSNSPETVGTPLLWIHTDGLNPQSPMLNAHPESPAIFVWDTEWITKSRITLKRLVFLAECLREMPGTIKLCVGDPATELLAAAKESGADYILAQRTPDPHLQRAARAVQPLVPIVWYDPPPFVQEVRSLDLKRFSRYWQRAQSSAMQLTERENPAL